MKQIGEIKLVADTPGKLLVELDRNNKSTTQPSNNTPTVVQTNTSVQTKSVPITTISNNSHSIEAKNGNMKDGESATLQSDLNAVQSASNSSPAAILKNDNADSHEYVDLGL